MKSLKNDYIMPWKVLKESAALLTMKILRFEQIKNTMHMSVLSSSAVSIRVSPFMGHLLTSDG